MKNVYMIKRIAVDAGCPSTFLSFHTTFEAAMATAVEYAEEYRTLMKNTWARMRRDSAWLITENENIVSVSYNDPQSRSAPVHLEFVVVKFPIAAKLDSDFVFEAFSLKRSQGYRDRVMAQAAEEIAKQRHY